MVYRVGNRFAQGNDAVRSVDLVDERVDRHGQHLPRFERLDPRHAPGERGTVIGLPNAFETKPGEERIPTGGATAHSTTFTQAETGWSSRFVGALVSDLRQ